MLRPAIGAGILAIVLGATGVGPAAAWQDARRAEIRLGALQNRERLAAGVGALKTSAALAAIARRHAAAMASAGDVWHQADLADVVQRWRVLGDNVGRGPGPDEVHAAFLESGVHRDNMLGPAFRLTGVGAAFDDEGSLYVAVVYVAPQPDQPRRAKLLERVPSQPRPDPGRTSPRPRPEPAPVVVPVHVSTVSMLVLLVDIDTGTTDGARSRWAS